MVRPNVSKNTLNFWWKKGPGLQLWMLVMSLGIGHRKVVSYGEPISVYKVKYHEEMKTKQQIDSKMEQNLIKDQRANSAGCFCGLRSASVMLLFAIPAQESWKGYHVLWVHEENQLWRELKSGRVRPKSLTTRGSEVDSPFTHQLMLFTLQEKELFSGLNDLGGCHKVNLIIQVVETGHTDTQHLIYGWKWPFLAYNEPRQKIILLLLRGEENKM